MSVSRRSSAVVLACIVSGAAMIGFAVASAGAEPPSTQPALAAPNSSNLRRPSPTLNLDKVAFIDALNFVVRDSLGLNMYVNWPAIEAAGIDKNMPISLRLRGVKASKVLDLILDQAGGGNVRLTWYVSDGVLHITTTEQAEHDVVTKVYPVQDLVMDVPNFDNGGFDFTQQNNNNGDPSNPGSSSGSNNSLFGGNGNNNNNNNSQNGTDSTGLTRQQRGEQLAQLVQQTLETQAHWSPGADGAAVSPYRVVYFNGELIVTAPRYLLQHGGR